MEDFLLRVFCWNAPFQQVLLVENSGHLDANGCVLHPLESPAIPVLRREQSEQKYAFFSAVTADYVLDPTEGSK